jgi:hypothetical protein
MPVPRETQRVPLVPTHSLQRLKLIFPTSTESHSSSQIPKRLCPSQNSFQLLTQSQTTARQQGHNTFSTNDIRTPGYLRILGLGYQSFGTGVTLLRLRFSFKVLSRKDINTEALSAPEVDDPVRWFVKRTIGTRYAQRAGLDKDVATEHGPLDEPGFM